MKKSKFFAFIFRIKYINRWALMRNTRNENVAEHSLEVAMVAHALALIQKNRLGNTKINTDRVAVLALYHDTSEIITGDLPTPVKYLNNNIKSAYKDIENNANINIMSLLPEYLKDDFKGIFVGTDEDKELYKIVKAADKICAYIKCIEEEKAGNTEFSKARETILNTLKSYNREDVNIFLDEFIDGFNLTLDELGVEL